MTEYNADAIEVLTGLDPVGKRPGMYTDTTRPNHLAQEVIDNSVDEALAGHCDEITVIINKDNSITVNDNGRGIPTGIHPKEKKSALEVVMTVLHAGGKFDKDSYKVSGGLHGVGVSCVNALSENLKATVYREGKVFEQEYQRGIPEYDVKEVGKTEKRGTSVTFSPDKEIFTEHEYKYDTVATRLRELSFLNAGIKIFLVDEREIDENGENKKETFFSEGGLVEFVNYLDGSREKLIPPIYMEGKKENVPVQVALSYNLSYSENVVSYVNNINTIEGGTHVAGFRRGLTRTLKSYALAIIGAEYILKWLPIGTHEWNKFVKPEDIIKICKKNKLNIKKIDGMKFDLLNDKWSLNKDTSVNYIGKFIKD